MDISSLDEWPAATPIEQHRDWHSVVRVWPAR